MKKDIKLYDVFFPVWFLLFFPPVFLLVLPVNFIIDTLVLLIVAKIIKVESIGKLYKSTILPIFLLGLCADILGSILVYCVYRYIYSSDDDNLFITIPGVIIAGVCIFVLNYFISFRKCEKRQRKILSLSFAIITAPYTFLIPTSLIYK